MRLSQFCLVLLISIVSGISNNASANTVGVVGLLQGKALLVINDAAPKTFAVGDSIRGVKLIAVDDNGAILEVGGKRRIIPFGQHGLLTSSDSGSSQPGNKVTLNADIDGHYNTQVSINGSSMPMLLDTGATMIALPAKEAVRMGIDYKSGTQIQVNTANGIATAYKVTLNKVRVGGLEVHQVDALVQENGLDVGLLGMSFLKRTDMRAEGQQMVLTKRF
jgi:aspartyl protease family protein